MVDKKTQIEFSGISKIHAIPAEFLVISVNIKPQVGFYMPNRILHKFGWSLMQLYQTDS